MRFSDQRLRSEQTEMRFEHTGKEMGSTGSFPFVISMSINTRTQPVNSLRVGYGYQNPFKINRWDSVDFLKVRVWVGCYPITRLGGCKV